MAKTKQNFKRFSITMPTDLKCSETMHGEITFADAFLPPLRTNPKP